MVRKGGNDGRIMAGELEVDDFDKSSKERPTRRFESQEMILQRNFESQSKGEQTVVLMY